MTKLSNKNRHGVLRKVVVVPADYCIPRNLTLAYIAKHYEAVRFEEASMFNTEDELRRDIERVVSRSNNF